MEWIEQTKNIDGVLVDATMLVGGRTLRFTPIQIETVGCAGGAERIDDGDENLPEGKRIAGLQAFVNLGAVLLAWANETHDTRPDGKVSADIAPRASLSAAGSRRCYLVSEDADLLSVMWFGFAFNFAGDVVTSPMGVEETLQSWCDRAQYVVDFYAPHGVVPQVVA